MGGLTPSRSSTVWLGPNQTQQAPAVSSGDKIPTICNGLCLAERPGVPGSAQACPCAGEAWSRAASQASNFYTEKHTVRMRCLCPVQA